MLQHRLIGAVAAVALAALPATLAAQTDYRNLDDDRPALTEDAYPVERFAFEFAFPFRFERERDGASVAALIPELTWGALADVQVGLKAPIARVGPPGGLASRTALSGLRPFVLWNFNTESAGLPALAVRADAVLPIGGLAEESASVLLKGLATRSFGTTRLHVNVAAALGDLGTPAATEASARWYAGAAVDHVFWRSSVLLIGELVARKSREGVPLAWDALVGTRVQLTPMLVLDAGVGRDLAADRGVTFTLGFTRQFAIAGLVRGTR